MNEKRCPFCFEIVPRDRSPLESIEHPHPYCYKAHRLPCGHFIRTECQSPELADFCFRSRKQLEKNGESKKVVLVKRAEDPRLDKLWCKHNQWQYVSVCVRHQELRIEGCVNCSIGKFFVKDEEPKKILIRRRKK